MNRSACGLQLGLRRGIFVTVMPSLAKTASKLLFHAALPLP
ncbi:hypothetical protein [Streptomyces spiralis]